MKQRFYYGRVDFRRLLGIGIGALGLVGTAIGALGMSAPLILVSSLLVVPGAGITVDVRQRSFERRKRFGGAGRSGGIPLSSYVSVEPVVSAADGLYNVVFRVSLCVPDAKPLALIGDPRYLHARRHAFELASALGLRVRDCGASITVGQPSDLASDGVKQALAVEGPYRADPSAPALRALPSGSALVRGTGPESLEQPGSWKLIVSGGILCIERPSFLDRRIEMRVADLCTVEVVDGTAPQHRGLYSLRDRLSDGRRPCVLIMNTVDAALVGASLWREELDYIVAWIHFATFRAESLLA